MIIITSEKIENQLVNCKIKYVVNAFNINNKGILPIDNCIDINGTNYLRENNK